MLIFASPWFWGAAASLVSGVFGWTTGFFASDSIKYLFWLAVVAAIAIAFFYVYEVTK